MPEPIDFYFDFYSPYGYLASLQIDQLAARFGREVRWCPFMLGAVFKVEGLAPLVDIPLVGEYARNDFARSARLLGAPFVLPEGFPKAALAPSRAYYWITDRDAGAARRFAKRVYPAVFAEGRDVTEPAVTADLAAQVGIDGDELSAALQEPAVKDRLKQETAHAIERGVCGSPFIFVDGEPFWGNDRLWQVEKWLQTSGW